MNVHKGGEGLKEVAAVDVSRRGVLARLPLVSLFVAVGLLVHVADAGSRLKAWSRKPDSPAPFVLPLEIAVGLAFAAGLIDVIRIRRGGRCEGSLGRDPR